jgi:hypothetical protein
LQILYPVQVISNNPFCRLIRLSLNTTLPEYKSLLANHNQKNILHELRRHIAQQNTLITISILTSVLILIFFFLDISGEVTLTQQNINLLALSVALLLLPWMAKVKFFGIEYERSIKEQSHEHQ